MSMDIYGSIRQLVSLGLHQNSQDIIVTPNTGITYTGTRTLQLPPDDNDSVLVSSSSTQTLTNKTISGSSNTISGISLTGSVTGILPIASGGTASGTTLSNNRVMISSGSAIVEATAITAARALISDSNGIPTQSATTSTELGYLSGATSSVQTQISAKVSKSGDTMSGNLTFGTGSSLLLTDSSTHTITVAAPTTVTSYTLTLPTTPGSNLQFLQTDGTGATTWASMGVTTFQANWITGDGTTKTITHNLGTLDVIVQLYDKTDGSTIFIDSVVRTDVNTLTLTSSQAPGAAGWRVLIHAS